MANRIVRSGFIRGRSSKRLTTWLRDVDSATASILAAGSSVLFASLTTEELALRPFTVVRVRGLLTVNSDQVGASEFVHGAIGFAVVSRQAVVAGVASVPTPTLEAESGLWFVHQYWAHTTVFQSATGFSENSQTNFEIDSKAMRKVDQGQDIVVVIENGSGNAGVEFILNFRILIKTN